MDRSLSTPVNLLAATALMLSGCATTVGPRAFLPVVQPPPADMAAFERDFSACASQVSEQASVFYGSHPGLKPVKEGVADFAPVGGSMGPGDMSAGVIGLIELVIIAGQASTRSHARQAHRQATEQDIQAAMTACLKARGHSVTAWRLATDGKAAPARLQTPTQPTGRAALAQEAEQAERSAAAVPTERAMGFRMAAERYALLAEGAGDPQERARWSAKAAEARRKADEPSPTGITLRMPPYAAAPGASALSEVPPRTFAVEAAREARPGLRPGSQIGQLSGGANGEVDSIPPPARLLQDIFSAELGAAGHRPSAETPDVRIVPEMRRFELWEVGGWRWRSDMNVAIDVTVSLQAPQQPARSRDYSATCTKKSGAAIVTAGLLTPIVADCLRQIGAQFRQDAAVRDFLNATGSQR